MKGAYYCKSLQAFLDDPGSEIRDSLTNSTSKNFYQQLSTQTTSWSNFIRLLKESFSTLKFTSDWGLLLEYPIPRRAQRIDAVLIAGNIIIVIEYKDGEGEYQNGFISQLEDYCLDIRDFHFESEGRIIIPLLFCPDAEERENTYKKSDDAVQLT